MAPYAGCDALSLSERKRLASANICRQRHLLITYKYPVAPVRAVDSTEAPMPAAPTPTPGELVAQRTITAYTLTSEQLRQSEALHRTHLVLSLASTVLGFAVLAALIAARFGPKLQRVVECISRRRFVQAILFIPPLLLILAICQLPLAIYAHRIALAYGLSVQSWPSWLGDWAKSELLTVIFATLCIAGLYAGIRRQPRRWWFYAWLCTLPIMAAMVFAAPVVIDPLFNRFQPLARTHPQLTTQLRSLAHSAGLDIPEYRIFLMHASDKVTTYNAYVTGFGATKRIVVWDTTARDLTLPQTLFIFGHEMGHYVLHHIYLGLAYSALLIFAGLWLTQRLAEAVLARCGQRLQIRALGDLSSLPVLVLLASLLAFVGDPLANTFSRWEEHQADVYGLAITRASTPGGAPSAPPSSSQAAAQAFQLLGEKSYAYPNPSPFLVFWSYSHPPIADRIRFALSHP
jgi:Zn-dependent protease with chaperone function